MRNIDTTNAIQKNRELKIERVALYNKNPKLCKQCSHPIPYRTHNYQDFCSRKCSSIYNNAIRYGIKQKRYCKRCNLLLSTRTTSNYCQKCNTIVLTEEIIKQKLPMTPKRLRKYLIAIRGHKCEECNLTTWRGKPIPLDNHHIDGNWKNNNLNNLKLTCKNCHALTDTYGSKNNGNGRPFTKKCKDSNIVVTK